MTILNLDYETLSTFLFVKIEVGYYKDTPSATPSAVDLLFSDRPYSTVIDGDTYVGLGNLLNITNTSSELRVSGSDLSVTISGIPNTSIAEIINSRIKGSPITIYRGLFGPNGGGNLLSITGNPVMRFKGFVNNLALDEEWDSDNRISSNTLVLSCASTVTVLENKVAGRKTNAASMKKFYPSDTSMDRVTALQNSYFDFGAKS